MQKSINTSTAPSLFSSLLLSTNLKSLISTYLEEDVPSFDIGGYVVGDEERESFLYCKEASKSIILAGIPFFDEVFSTLGCLVHWYYKEGDVITVNELEGKEKEKGKVIVASITGPCRKLLLGERTSLNIISRASGIATAAKELSELAREQGWHGEVAGTRKTTPGFRLIEKYALLVGGCSTHRMDLSSMVMLKDNHVWATGSITNAVLKARKACGFSSKIEVEARSLEEAKEACAAGCDIVMLDNYPTADSLIVDAEKIKQLYPTVLIEASGGITRSTISSYFSPFVDVISSGSLTAGYDIIDFSLKIKK
jgi:nicotinate-nucleotide pyrophosphorylase (carboxylating)